MSTEPAPAQEQTALVPVNPAEDNGAMVPIDPFSARRSMVSYFDASTPGRIAQLGSAVQMPETNWEDFMGEVVTVVGMTFFTRRITKHEEFPVRYALYTAIHLQSGENIVTSSKKLLDDLPVIKRAYGEPPWPAGALFTVAKLKTGSGRPLYTLAVGDQTIPARD